MFDFHSVLIILISGAVTAFLRFLPFIAFSNKRPEFILYLGRVLPYSVMAMLVIYCLKNTDIYAPYPEIISCLAVIGLHVWKRNTLLSIIAGTILYMFLVQVVM